MLKARPRRTRLPPAFKTSSARRAKSRVGMLLAALDLADVGRVVAHVGGEAFLREAAYLAPVLEVGNEVLGGLGSVGGAGGLMSEV